MLSDYEKSIVCETRKCLLHNFTTSAGWCGHCSYLLRSILGRGEITYGAVWHPSVQEENRRRNLIPIGHWWLEISLDLELNSDPYIVDITGDQFNRGLGEFSLPEVVLGNRSFYKVYYSARRDDFAEFSSILTVNDGALRNFYEEMNDRYPTPQISALLGAKNEV